MIGNSVSEKIQLLPEPVLATGSPMVWQQLLCPVCYENAQARGLSAGLVFWHNVLNILRVLCIECTLSTHIRSPLQDKQGSLHNCWTVLTTHCLMQLCLTGRVRNGAL